MATPSTSAPVRARVSQLARVLGVGADSVIRQVGSPEVASENDWVEPGDVDKILSTASPRRDPLSLRVHVVQIVSERQGRGEESVSLPVLKNQLLNLAGSSFHEADFGWPNLRFLPASYPDLLQLDSSSPHGHAKFLAPAKPSTPASDAEESPTKRHHIRRDLWDAVIDYRRGETYVWDAHTGKAVTTSDGDEDARPRFPTVSAEDVRDWRKECADGWLSVFGDENRSRVERWVDVPRERVPHTLIRRWQAEQRGKVVGIVEDFFAQEGIPLPDDALPSELSTHAQQAQVRSLTQREILKASASVMTDAELSDVQLPLGVLYRTLLSLGVVAAPSADR